MGEMKGNMSCHTREITASWTSSGRYLLYLCSSSRAGQERVGFSRNQGTSRVPLYRLSTFWWLSAGADISIFLEALYVEFIRVGRCNGAR